MLDFSMETLVYLWDGVGDHEHLQPLGLLHPAQRGPGQHPVGHHAYHTTGTSLLQNVRSLELMVEIRKEHTSS